MKDFAAIVLAAGVGKRMKSPISKVLHTIGGKPLIARTLDIISQVSPKQTVVVANPTNFAQIKKLAPNVEFAIQKVPKGTLDAAVVGLAKVKKEIDTVAVFYGDDTAFYKPTTVASVLKRHQKQKAALTFVTLIKENPHGLGRVVRKNGKILQIVEEKEATANQKKIKEINDGIYFFDKNWLFRSAPKIKPSKITQEYYLPDLVNLALLAKQKVEAFRLADSSQWHGVDTPEELARARLKLIAKIHIMGIAGSGASAVANIAKSYRYQVDGCDLELDSAYSNNLQNLPVKKNHSPKHLKEADLLVVSPAILKFDPNNQEIVAAKREGTPVLTWQAFQGQFLQKDKFVITVAGAFGKSTTTAMIAQILTDAGFDPTAEIGANVLSWGKNFRVGGSKYYVCEADEYWDNFLNYQSDIAVILNVSWDHPDYFKSSKDVQKSYLEFVSKIKSGGVAVLAKNPQLNSLSSSFPKKIKIVKVADFSPVKLAIIGDFRQENANAALAVADLLGINLELAKKSLATFTGVGRRLEFKGTIKNVQVFDDYAVQPYTVYKTANALAAKFPSKKMVLVFEPHTFSRIKTFFADFVKSLRQTKVDFVYITDVYAAREVGDSQKLAKRLARSIGSKALYTGSLNQTANYLKKHQGDFEVVCLMGAGKVYELWQKLTGEKKWKLKKSKTH